MRAVVIPAETKPYVTDTDGRLDELQAVVGGFIEAVSIAEDAHLFCNEEGKIKGLGVNRLATALAFGGNLNDVIVGDVIVLGTLDERGQQDGEEHDVPDWVIDAVAVVTDEN